MPKIYQKGFVVSNICKKERYKDWGELSSID